MAKKVKSEERLEIQEIEMNEITFNTRGQSPLIMERFQQKAWQELLLPAPSKNRVERQSSLKHDPIAEFRGAVYRCRDPKAPTLIHVPQGAFHGALANAALDIPGATKSKIERLTRVVDVTIHLYGVPHVFCAMVRNSDMNHTPDVRTRPIFPQWACRVTIRYVKSLLTERTIGNLFGAAGMISGIGGWRGEKGGSYGAWINVGDNDAEFKQILKQGRAAQIAALENPIYYDQDTEELLTWFNAEVIRRERQDLLQGAPKKTVKRGIDLSIGVKPPMKGRKVHVEDNGGGYRGTEVGK